MYNMKLQIQMDKILSTAVQSYLCLHRKFHKKMYGIQWYKKIMNLLMSVCTKGDIKKILLE